jgi:hypothetical protein
MKARSVVSGIAYNEDCTQGSQEPVEGAGEVVVGRWDKKEHKGRDESKRSAGTRKTPKKKSVKNALFASP